MAMGQTYFPLNIPELSIVTGRRIYNYHADNI